MAKPKRLSPMRQCVKCNRILRDKQAVVEVSVVLDDDIRGIRFVPAHRYAHLVCPPVHHHTKEKE